MTRVSTGLYRITHNLSKEARAVAAPSLPSAAPVFAFAGGIGFNSFEVNGRNSSNQPTDINFSFIAATNG